MVLHRLRLPGRLSGWYQIVTVTWCLYFYKNENGPHQIIYVYSSQLSYVLERLYEKVSNSQSDYRGLQIGRTTSPLLNLLCNASAAPAGLSSRTLRAWLGYAYPLERKFLSLVPRLVTGWAFPRSSLVSIDFPVGESLRPHTERRFEDVIVKT